jgi:transposase
VVRKSHGLRIWLCRTPADMRKSYDGLAALVETVLRSDPFSGHWFVFVNRRANRMKILCWEGDGFALWQKRLEKGTFRFPENQGEVTLSELGLILDGIEWREVRKLPRYSNNQINMIAD